MYRAVTWWMLRHGVDVHDPEAVAARCDEPRIDSGTDPLAPTIEVDGEDVAVEIRGDDVNAAVSPVSAVPRVRARLQVMQRRIIEEAIAARTAASSSRAATSGPSCGRTPPSRSSCPPTPRRAPRAGPPRRAGATWSATRESLLARDQIDSGRAVSPLVLADGAVHVDTHRPHPGRGRSTRSSRWSTAVGAARP